MGWIEVENCLVIYVQYINILLVLICLPKYCLDDIVLKMYVVGNKYPGSTCRK